LQAGVGRWNRLYMPVVSSFDFLLADPADASWSDIRLYQGALDWLRGHDVPVAAARLGRALKSDPVREMALRDFVCRFYARQVAIDLAG